LIIEHNGDVSPEDTVFECTDW